MHPKPNFKSRHQNLKMLIFDDSSYAPTVRGLGSQSLAHWHRRSKSLTIFILNCVFPCGCLAREPPITASKIKPFCAHGKEREREVLQQIRLRLQILQFLSFLHMIRKIWIFLQATKGHAYAEDCYQNIRFLILNFLGEPPTYHTCAFIDPLTDQP